VIKSLPAADLCAGAKPFGAVSITLSEYNDVVSLVASDRSPKFVCALVAASGVVAPPFGLSTVGCVSSDPNTTAPPSVSGNFIGLFRSLEYGPATIRAAFAAPTGEVNTFVASAGSSGGVTLSTPITLRQKAPAGSTAAIASTGAVKDDPFVVFDQPSAVVTAFKSDGTKIRDYPTPGVPPALLWGESVFADTNGIVLIAGLEGAMNKEHLRPRVSYFLPNGSGIFQTVTDLEADGGATPYSLDSGGFERLVLLPGTNAPGTGAAIVAVRGMSKGAPISALVLAKPAPGGLLPNSTNSVRISALPTRYGLAGSVPTDPTQKTSIYVGISDSAMKEWSNGACTSGMIAAFEPQ
jgi:hypothetical protein